MQVREHWDNLKHCRGRTTHAVTSKRRSVEREALQQRLGTTAGANRVAGHARIAAVALEHVSVHAGCEWRCVIKFDCIKSKLDRQALSKLLTRIQ